MAIAKKKQHATCVIDALIVASAVMKTIVKKSAIVTVR